MSDPIRFDDAAAYERYMGCWSQLAGNRFLGRLEPAAGLRWLDIGCGNGAFTEIIATRCSPASIEGIDPSAEQLAYARARPLLRDARFRQADAMALPYPDGAFDIAVMPLVIFFVPDPARGVAEMVRVVRPGGRVAAYAWDMESGGFPYDALAVEMRALGVETSKAPSPQASRTDVLQKLWADAELEEVTTWGIAVQRTFAGFDDYWETILGAPSAGAKLAAMSAADLRLLKARMRARLPENAAGHIVCDARANAVAGQVPTR